MLLPVALAFLLESKTQYMPKATKKKKEKATDFSVRNYFLSLHVACLAQYEFAES